MTNFLWAMGASLMVSLISFVGIFSLFIKAKLLDRTLIPLVGFSAGGLIGSAFLHLVPEALEQAKSSSVLGYIITGFIVFFILERYFYWRHCHNGHCDIHAFTYLNLIGDGIHNFTDGLVIGASFTVSIYFGAVTTLVVIFHEIPQEIGDFGVLVYGGLDRFRALFFNFLSALTAVGGTFIGYHLSKKVVSLSPLFLLFTAGGFIYIAACDLIPELHKQTDFKRTALSVISFLMGIFFVLLARLLYVS